MVFTCRDEAIAALTGSESDARKAAADYLSDDGSLAAVKALIAALSDPLADVQINVAEALGNCRNLAAVAPLSAVLLNTDAPAATRQTAARSLGTLGYLEGIEALIAALKAVIDDPEHTDHNVVRAAARALGIMGQRVGDEDVRKQVVEGLVVLLDAHSAVLRQSGVVALTAYRDTRSVLPLTKTLTDESWLVRQAAVLALAEVGGIEVGPAVENMMNDPNRNVRIAAADALEKLVKMGYGE